MRVRHTIRRELLLTALLLATATITSPPAEAQTARLVSRDAVVAGTLSAANEGEITHARIALERASHPDVRGFASRMLREHSIADEQLRRVLVQMAAVEAARTVARDIEENCTQTAELLRQLSSADFDRTYMELQIERHEWLLRAIDGTLLPAARDETVRAQLRMVRTSVADHLDRARQVRARLDH